MKRAVTFGVVVFLFLVQSAVASGPMDGGGKNLPDRPGQLYSAEVICKSCRDAELFGMNIKAGDKEAAARLIVSQRCAISEDGVLVFKLDQQQGSECIKVKPKGYNFALWTARGYLTQVWSDK